MQVVGMSLGEFLDWVRRDRDSAWAAIHGLAHDRATRLARRWRLQSADVDDLGDELLIRCVADDFAALRHGPPATALAAWVTGIATNMLREWVRRSTGPVGTPEFIGDEVTEPIEGVAPASEGAFDAPHLSLELLTPKQRTVIELLREGKSEREIAAHLGVTRDSVHELKQRAVARLRSGRAWTPPRPLPNRWWAIFYPVIEKRDDDPVSFQVIALHGQGVTRREIAHRTGLSMKAVKERIARRRPEK